MDNDVIVKFNRVNYELDGSKILNDINGSIYKGYITSIIGPSGAGKSTLLSFINLLKSPSNGDISINNKHIDTYNPIELRKKVQLVSQEATMIEGSVKDNLELPLKLQNKNMTDEEVVKFLTSVDLPASFLNKSSKSLSGGEKQKLSLARALVNRPEVILLDEVTSALDRNSKNAIEQLLLKIKAEYQVSMIWITHDIDQAMRMSDYIWVMIDGEVAEIGTADEINHSTNQNVRRFIGEKRI
ncbi:phosphate ABC transporter ATP-binding protein [Mammaliicoccus sp. Dog046]|uniref:ABC transporter ATP-binding protein n=1 Tax=Mammaliicoccus sp. Dog046 TaxID=3034233 RepID=UPI002B25837F|nr:phosphate ABC transporter ATP-binding protein [Mammaliicoccus sp. Dog046]WQK86206.1 phosphate ABC transporter ATP-binding protein [Mammaliicoccus sp. Dog046]